MASSIAVETTQAVMSAYDITTIINNINTLYANVINQFVSIALGMVALFGVVLPLIFAYFQKRKIIADHKILAEKIEKEMQATKLLLTEEMKLELKEEKTLILQEIEKMKLDMGLEIGKIKAGADAKAHHLQANSNIAVKNFKEAFIDAGIAIKNYENTNDDCNLMRVAEILLLKMILPNLKKTDFDDEKLDKSYKSINKCLKENNSSGRYTDCLDGLERAYKLALAREVKVAK